MLQKHINADLNNPCGLRSRCRIVQSTVMMQQIDCHRRCAQLHIVLSHAPTTTLMRILIIAWARCTMRNNAVNSHDATDKLSFLMCVVEHCSLTCTKNRINADLNNPRGLGARCITMRSTIMMKQTNCCL